MTTFVLTILAFILLFGGLFTYFNIKSRNEDKAVLKSFHDFAANHYGEITKHDKLINLVIGYAANTNTLFFFNFKSSGRIETMVPLSEVVSCTLHKPVRRSLDGRDTTVELVELILEYGQGKRPSERFTFYNLEEGSLTLQGELQLAEQWHVFINEILKKHI